MKARALQMPLFVAAMLVSVAVLAAYLTEASNQDWGSPSSYSSRQYGAKAAYLLLLQSGYRVERWSRPPQELPVAAVGTTLVMAGAEQIPDGDEAKALERFVRAGGRLLVTGWWIGSTGLPNSLDAGVVRVGFAECKPSAPTELTQAGPITQEGVVYWQSPDADQLVHYRDEQGHPVVVSYSLAQGEVVWWASPLPLTNIEIRNKGNLDLFLNSLGKDRRILWDEYFHGSHRAEHMGRYAVVLRWGEYQVLLLGAVLLFAYARRSGPVLRLARASRLSPLEFVHTMGSVFHKADARQAPLEIAFARLQRIAVRRLSLPPNADAEEIANAMQRRGYGVSETLSEHLRAARNAMLDPGLTEGKAIEHVRTIYQVLAKLERERTTDV